MQNSAVSYIYELITNRVFLSAVFSWFVAQVVKAVIELLRSHSRSYRDVGAVLLWRTGGMPSSHASMVTALATSIGFQHGLSSHVFVLSLFYGLVIVRDAVGVRRSAGVQAQALNALGKQLSERHEIDFVPVKEVSGHTPAEVSVGMLLGFFIAVAFSIL